MTSHQANYIFILTLMNRIYFLIFGIIISISTIKAQAPLLVASNETASQGDTVTVTYTVTDFWNICNFNGTITWDPTVISFLNIGWQAQPLVTYPAQYGTSMTSQGLLTFTWAHPLTVGATIQDNTPIFLLKFIATGNSGTSSVMGFSNNPVPLYYYNFAAWTGPISVTNGSVTISGSNPILPNASFSVSGTGFYRVFTDASTGNPSSWLWEFGDGTTSTLQNPTHYYPAASAYQACLTVTNPNGSDSSCMMVYPSINVGLQHTEMEDFLVYYNIENQSITIETGNNNFKLAHAELFNISGQQISSQNLTDGRSCVINAANLKPGLYFVKINSPGSNHIKKLIIH